MELAGYRFYGLLVIVLLIGIGGGFLIEEIYGATGSAGVMDSFDQDLDMRGNTIQNLGEFQMQTEEEDRVCQYGDVTTDTRARSCIGNTCTDWITVEEGSCPGPDLSAYTPYLFTWTADGYEVVSDFLFGHPTTAFASVAAGMSAYESGRIDPETLIIDGEPETRDGQLIFEIRELAVEQSYFDSIDMDVVKHPSDSVVLPAADTGELYAIDEDVVADLIQPTRQQENVFVFEDAGSRMLLVGMERLSIGDPEPVTVSYKVDGGWKELTELKPRYPDERKELVRIPGDADSPVKVKVDRWQSFARLSSIGVLPSFRTTAFKRDDLEIEEVKDMNTGERYMDTLREEGEFLRLRSGDRIRMEFEAERLDWENRTAVMRTDGFYVPLDAEDRRVTDNAIRIRELEETVEQLREPGEE